MRDDKTDASKGGEGSEALWMPLHHPHNCFSCLQDKKGLSGKQNNFDRKAVYQRQVRAPSLLAKSILEGKNNFKLSFGF